MLDATGAAIGSDTTSIDGKTPALGAAVIAASTPVNIASDQTVPVSAASLPLPADAATETTLSSIDTDTSTIAGDTTSLDAKVPAQGAAVIAASTPVNIASDQTVPISAASLPLPADAATETTLATIDTDTGVIAGDTTSINGKTPALGAAVIASSVPVNIASDQVVPVSTTALDVIDFIDTTPVLDTGSSTIPSATFLEIVASTAAITRKIKVNDTTGIYIGLYTGPGASEVLKAIIGPGEDGVFEVNIPAATRISLQSFQSDITNGLISIQFIG